MAAAHKLFDVVHLFKTVVRPYRYLAVIVRKFSKRITYAVKNATPGLRATNICLCKNIYRRSVAHYQPEQA